VAPVEQQNTIGPLVKAVAREECLLFLGAGVHCAPPEGSAYKYPPEHRPPLGGQLSRALSEESGFAREFPGEDERNLARVSLYYEQSFKRHRLVEVVEQSVDENRKPSAAVLALASLPFPIVVTTNYDRIFERALQGSGKEPHVSVYSPDHNTPTADHKKFDAQRPFVFKIHGDISRPESIVITDEDYIHFVMRMRDREPYYPVPETINYRMKCWPTLFVGYRLTDYNLRLLFKSLRWRVDKADLPDAYSVDKYPDPLIRAVYQQNEMQVQFVVEDVWSFVPQLYRQVTGREMV
jgi:SIR2-like domain